MNQMHASKKKHAWDQRRGRFDDSRFDRAPATERTSRPPSVNRLCVDWFALRIWDDDGGGQTQVS